MRKLLPFLFVLSVSVGNLFAQCTPPPDVTISGPVSGCTDRVATYTISTSAGATSYLWNITGTSSKTQQSDTKYSIVFENSNVTIEVTPMNGTCAGNKTTITIPVSQTPNKPSIAQSGNNLDASTTATSYQWYLESTAIAGATAKTFTPTSNGSYLVEAKNANGCSTFSNSFNFFKTAIKEDAVFAGFSFYPNPVTTKLFVDFNSRYDLSFTDLLGHQVLQQTDLQGKQEIDLSSLKRGLYLMKVNSNGKTAVRKLLLK
nr:T9SS type A sorting domain-containing protein [uncultured Pedobacter sp.]